jgi:hypothetical protein
MNELRASQSLSVSCSLDLAVQSVNQSAFIGNQSLLMELKSGL